MREADAAAPTPAKSAQPFSDSAEFYDAIYTAERDYASQARRVAELVLELNPAAQTLLDVGCGTGLHIEHLRHRFVCEGVDVSAAMLRIASHRNPGVRFHRGDMRDLDTGRSYDGLICMFSSITYAQDLAGLERTLSRFAAHLVPGGACLIEPFIPLESWVDEPTGHVRFADLPELAVAAVDRAVREGRTVVREIAYAASTSMGLRQIWERHVFGLFTTEEYVKAFRGAGFEVEHDRQGFDLARGLYVARRVA